MSQNLISLGLNDADYATIDQAIATLEAQLTGLLSLSNDERRSLYKMGDKSEAFCRQTLTVMAQNPQLLPASVELVIAETEPGIQGDRVSGARKPATLETGLVVQVPLFVGPGEAIKVDTRSGEYITRA